MKTAVNCRCESNWRTWYSTSSMSRSFVPWLCKYRSPGLPPGTPSEGDRPVTPIAINPNRSGYSTPVANTPPRSRLIDRGSPTDRRPGPIQDPINIAAMQPKNNDTYQSTGTPARLEAWVVAHAPSHRISPVRITHAMAHTGSFRTSSALSSACRAAISLGVSGVSGGRTGPQSTPRRLIAALPARSPPYFSSTRTIVTLSR